MARAHGLWETPRPIYKRRAMLVFVPFLYAPVMAAATGSSRYVPTLKLRILKRPWTSFWPSYARLEVFSSLLSRKFGRASMLC